MPEQFDKGMAAERTALAWSRTSLAVLVNGGLLLLRHLTASLGTLEAVLGVVSLLLAVLVVAFGRLRALQIRHAGAQPPGPSRVVVLGLGVAFTAFALLVTAGVLVG